MPTGSAAGVLVDSFVPPPERKTPGWVVSGRPPPRYASEAEIVMRYRFAPPQDSDHPDIVDFLARRSVRQDPASGEWAWCFDPRMWATVDRSAADRFVEQARVPLGLIRGEDSALVSRDHLAAMATRLPDCRFVTEVAGARHHVMVDQPQALVTALAAGIAELEKH
jgi:pimeloyl-ACP methyl ester carboxylesterase